MSFITVYESEDSDPVEIPLENDNTVLFTTLSGQFPKVSGLKYRYSESSNFRAVKLFDGKLFKPAEGWADIKFQCVFPKDPAAVDNKRKCKEDCEISTPKTKRLETGVGSGRKCTDLIVLNLGWKVDEDILRNYFGEKFGELVLVQVKKDRETSHSRGYAFIRFADYESQVLCLAEKHLIDGRWCAVKVPFSKNEADKQEISKKIHVSYNSEDITMEDLRQSFEEYGYVTDIFIPKPFRNFAFVTFESSNVAQQLIGRTLAVKGFTLTIGSAVPKIVGPKKGSVPHSQFPSSVYSSYNDPSFPGARYMWSAAASYDQSMQATYKPRSSRNSAYNSYTGLIQAPNASYLLTNGRGHADSMISLDYPSQHPPSSDMGQNTAAMAALNILNNPEVVAAIVAAASKSNAAGPQNMYSPQQQQHGSMQ